MTIWADYSAGRPGGAALRAAGFAGAIRYIGLGSAGKRITADEYRDLVATGLGVLLVAEYDTHDAEGGYNRGRANAQVALDEARALGIPDSVGIAAAADEHLTAAQIPVAVDYVRGFRDVLGVNRTGAYGFGEFVGAVKAAGFASWYWKAGNGPTADESTWVQFWQRNVAPSTMNVNGIDCDINELLQSGDDVTPEQDVLLRDIHEQLCGSGSRTPGAYPGWIAEDGTGRNLTVVDLIREAHRELNQKLANRIDGKTSDTALGFAANGDAYGYRLTQRVAELVGKVDGLSTALAQLAQKGVAVDLAAVTAAAEAGSRKVWVGATYTASGTFSPSSIPLTTPSK